MLGRFAFFVLGGLTVIVAKDPLRRAAKRAIVGALKMSETVNELAAEAREDMADKAAVVSSAASKKTN